MRGVAAGAGRGARGAGRGLNGVSRTSERKVSDWGSFSGESVTEARKLAAYLLLGAVHPLRLNSITAAPSFAVAAPPRPKRQLALAALLVGEILYLTLRFDSQALASSTSGWTTVVGWSPLLLRLAISVVVLTGLIGGRRFIAALGQCTAPRASSQLSYLALHGVALFGFVAVSGTVFGAGSAVAANPGLWAAAWGLSGTLTIGSWGVALFPPAQWRGLITSQWRVICWGFVAGTAVWAAGLATEGAWTHLARYTFASVAWMLGAFYPDVVIIPERLVVGTSAFRVNIAPTCSGYEGVGLILTFLGIYLYLFRKELRFPGALVLLPLGAVVIWILNAVRIVALIAIGTSGWREIALGGFHSQAGWLLFNAVGLTFVALIHHGGYFTKDPLKSSVRTRDQAADSTTAFLGPFVTLLAAAMVTGAFSAGFDWLYPVRVAAVALVIWSCRAAYQAVRWSGSPTAVVIGFLTFVLWVALLPADLTAKDGWPAALQSVPTLWAGVWLLVRVFGYVVIAPIAEELAFRGYLTRRLIQSNIDQVPVGTFSWTSFLLTSLIFGAFHGPLWLPGTMAGMAFGLAMYRRRSLGDAVLAHATTNGLIVCYVFATGRWSVWS